jgi:uncharacterized protein (TIGR03437 family)
METSARCGLLCLCGLLGAHSLWAQPTIVEYPIPTSGSNPQAITAGPDGNLWFVETAGNKIGKIAPTGTITEYSIATANAQPSAITQGPDGNLWFTEAGAGNVGRISTGGTITEYAIPLFGAPGGIAAGPDGNLWFTGYLSGEIGKITPSGSITEYELNTPGCQPNSIASGPDGNLWVTQSCPTFSYIGKVTTAGVITQEPLERYAQAYQITRGPGGDLWYTTNGAWVGSINTSGTAALYPTAGQAVQGVALGPDGNLWLAGGSTIGRITPGLALTQYTIPSSGSEPFGITPGPDGNIWFTEYAGNKIGKVVLSSVPATSLLTVTPASLTFTGQQGATAPPPQSISVSSPSPVSFTASSSAWNTAVGLSITPSGALATNQTIAASVGEVGINLNGGSYSGAVVLTSGNVSQIVPVTLNATAAGSSILLTTSPPFMNFNYAIGGPLPASQTLQVSAIAAGVGTQVPITASASSAGNWLSVTPSGTTQANLTVSVSPSGLAAGNYSGTITINGTGAAEGRSVTAMIYLNVTAPPVVVSTSFLSFTAQAGGAAPPSQTFTVTGPSPAAFSAAAYSAIGGISWLSISPAGNLTTNQTITVTANPAGLEFGTYSGAINVSWGASVNTVQVTFNLTPAVSVNPSSLAFTYQIGGSVPQAQKIAVTGPGGAEQAFTASAASGGNWLSLSAAAGYTPEALSVSVSPAGLTAGTYNGSVSITAAGGVAVAVPVSLIVTGSPTSSILSVNPTSLNFGYTQGSGAPAQQSVQLSTASGTNVAFTDSSNATWLSVSPASGNTPSTLSVSVAGNLSAGTYSGMVLVTPANGSAVPVPVSVTVASAAAPTISASPSSLSFGYRLGGSAPAQQAIQLTGSGGAALAFTAAATSQGSWLSVAPASGTTPATLEVSLSTAGLSAGTYNGTITVNGGALTIPVTLTVSAATTPLPTITAVVNSASYASGAVSPGEMITIGGTGLGPANPAYLTLDSNGNVSTAIGGVTVTIGGTPAPMVYAGSNQINAIVPYEARGLLAPSVLVNYLGQSSNGYPLQTAAAAPGIFTQSASGSGPGTILNQDYTVNGPNNPAPKGSTIIVYLTGEGQTSPGGVDGQVTMVNTSGVGPVTPAPLLQVSVLVGGAAAPVQFAGEAPGLVAGVLQVNVQIPANAPTGDVPISVSIGTSSSQQGVTVSVQ